MADLLVDDGNKSRSNRKMLFQEAYNKIGVGCAPHNKFKSITVLMYATNYISNEISTGPITHTTTSKYTNIGKHHVVFNNKTLYFDNEQVTTETIFV